MSHMIDRLLRKNRRANTEQDTHAPRPDPRFQHLLVAVVALTTGFYALDNPERAAALGVAVTVLGVLHQFSQRS